MMRSPYGSPRAAWQVRAQRVVHEAIRQVKLAAKNDPNFVPRVDGAQAVLAGEVFAPPAGLVPDREPLFEGPTSRNVVLAQETFRAPPGLAGVTGRRLTFGPHLTPAGGTFDGTKDVTLATDAVATSTPSTLVARDGSGDFAAHIITADLIGNVTGNATTATRLQTPRQINGVAFDGTGNITVAAAAGTLTGTALASGVTSSTLQVLGALTDIALTPTATADLPVTHKVPVRFNGVTYYLLLST